MPIRKFKPFGLGSGEWESVYHYDKEKQAWLAGRRETPELMVAWMRRNGASDAVVEKYRLLNQLSIRPHSPPINRKNPHPSIQKTALALQFLKRADRRIKPIKKRKKTVNIRKIPPGKIPKAHTRRHRMHMRR